MNKMYLRHITLNLITFSVLLKIGWCYRDSGQSYSHHHGGQHVPFGSIESGIRNNGNCPLPRQFAPNEQQLIDNVAYECLPSYLRNPNAVLDDDDGTIEWARGQKPDYTVVNEMFDRERTIVHPKGSMEDRISNLMKNWDKELNFKPNQRQWVTIVPDNYYMIINGGPRLSLPEIFQLGSYNMFLGNSEFYSKNYINASTADNAFRTTLRSGFAIEVLKVYSPPPRVTFKFRHWGHMTGPLRCPMRNGTWLNAPPHGRRVEFFGHTALQLNEKYQVMSVENTFRGDTLMEQMVLGTGTGTGNGNGNIANIGNGGGDSWNW